MYFIVGCGGGGSFLLSILSKTVPVKEIMLIDGDKLERKNLSRQIIFTEADIGKFKADALAEKIGCKSLSRYITEFDPFEFGRRDVVFICVDNNPARKVLLEKVDQAGCICFVCANEYDSAQTYLYRSAWKDTPDDPRVRFPTILTDQSNDPTKPHCAEEYADNEQLATFNAISATFAMHLFYLWTQKKDVDINLKSKQFSCNFNKYRSQ